MDESGKKICISGGTRCNVLPAEVDLQVAAGPPRQRLSCHACLLRVMLCSKAWAGGAGLACCRLPLARHELVRGSTEGAAAVAPVYMNTDAHGPLLRRVQRDFFTESSQSALRAIFRQGCVAGAQQAHRANACPATSLAATRPARWPDPPQFSALPAAGQSPCHDAPPLCCSTWSLDDCHYWLTDRHQVRLRCRAWSCTRPHNSPPAPAAPPLQPPSGPPWRSLA